MDVYRRSISNRSESSLEFSVVIDFIIVPEIIPKICDTVNRLFSESTQTLCLSWRLISPQTLRRSECLNRCGETHSALGHLHRYPTKWRDRSHFVQTVSFDVCVNESVLPSLLRHRSCIWSRPVLRLQQSPVLLYLSTLLVDEGRWSRRSWI